MTKMTSNGALLSIHDGVSTYNAIGGIISFSGFGGGSATVIDVTDLDDTYKQKIAGQIDSGEISISAYDELDDTYQVQVDTDFKAGTVRSFRVTMTDTGPTTYTFSAVISGYTKGVSLDDKITLEMNLAVTGGYTKA